MLLHQEMSVLISSLVQFRSTDFIQLLVGKIMYWRLLEPTRKPGGKDQGKIYPDDARQGEDKPAPLGPPAWLVGDEYRVEHDHSSSQGNRVIPLDRGVSALTETSRGIDTASGVLYPHQIAVIPCCTEGDLAKLGI